MSYLYQYTKTPVACDRLTLEIQSNASITKALDYITFLSTNQLNIYFKETLPEEQITALTTLVTNHTGEPLPENIVSNVTLYSVDKTSSAEKALKVADTKLEGSSTMFCSPNFCDKTTWYEGSTRITSETLTTSDNLTFSSIHTYWVDLCHGKIPYEDRIDSTGNLYKAHIFIDDVETTSGYTIDYINGTIVFESSQEGKTIKATYNYAGAMQWTITPSSGKILKLIGTEIKFTKDCVLNGNKISFQPCVSGQAYGQPTIYKNMEDIVKCCMGQGWIVPSFDSINKDIICLPFDYVTSKDLKASQAASIKITLSSTTQVTGTFATCIGYCISITE